MQTFNSTRVVVRSPWAIAFILLAQCTNQPRSPERLVGVTSAALSSDTVAGEPAPIIATATVNWNELPHEPTTRVAGANDGPSPTLSSNFQALAYNGNYPPDPSGAVGPGHIVVVANGTVRVTDRAGVDAKPVVTLFNFWNGSFALTAAAHPRVTYDPYGGRFIVASRGDHCEMVPDPDNGGTKCDYTYYLMLAVSQSSDPTGEWNQFQVQADDGSYDPNFTVLGFNKTWIAAGMNMTVCAPIFGCLFNGGSPLWVFDKAAVYANTATTPTKLSRNDGTHAQLTPATTMDATVDPLYVMQNASDSSGTLKVYKITGAVGSPSLSLVGTSTSGSSWAGTSANANDQLPYGAGFLPQKNSSTKISPGDARLTNVVYRNGSLWTSHTIFSPAATPTHASVAWWQVTATTGATVQRGVIDDATAATSYAWPSISVNADNNALVGFSRFSATEFPTAAYAFRQSSDAAGTMRTDAVLKAGAGTYTRAQLFMAVYWGSYSTTLTDPVDDSTLWTMQQYASGSNGWGLWWGRVHPTIPVLTSPGDKTTAEMVNLSFSLSATDADNDPITFSSPNLPSGATLSPAGVFSWTPSYIQQGTYNVTLTATDSTQLTDSKTIQITVTNVYDPPVLSPIGTKNGSENALLQFTVSATDPQGRPLTYSSSTLPSGASFDVNTHVFSWTPSYAQAGTYAVTFTVADNIPLSTSEVVTIIIGNANRAPSLSPIGDRSSPEGTNISFTVSGTDPDGETLTYSATALPSGATLNATTGAFSWTPSYQQAGIYQTVFAASDPGGLTSIWNVTFTITDLNRAPTLNPIGSRTTLEGTNLAFTVVGTDPDSDVLTYSVSGLPAGATISQAGSFSWTPAYNQSGIYDVTIKVTDPGGLFAAENLSIEVGNVNQPPSLAPVTMQFGAEGTLLTFALSGSDPDNEALTYSAQGLPSGASLDIATGVVTWTPGYSAAGTYNVTFKVMDGGSLFATQPAIIVIANTNRAPTIDPLDPLEVTERQSVSFVVTANDPDGQAVVLSVVGLPTGATFNADSGLFSWTPATAQSGVYNITFKATDPDGLFGTGKITLTVVGTNKPPVLTPIAPITFTAGRTLSFVAIANDPNADPLTFSGQRLPEGATLDPGSGTFTWPTSPAQVGSYSISITATDPQGLSDTITISITLVTNQAPILSSMPPLFGDEGAVLSYTVTATDPNGDPLIYSMPDLPTGAFFDTGTHTLRWTPGYDQSGTYDVTVFVTDTLDIVSTSTTITIANTNRAPLMAPIGPRTVTEGAQLIFSINAGDPDGDAVTFSASSVPEGAVFDPTTRVFRWRPSYQQEGSYSVEFAATDPLGAAATQTITITVLNANGPPTIDTMGTIYGTEGLPLSVLVTGSDPDDDPITFIASNLPSGASFDTATQTFSWTPSYTQAGNHSFTVKATDTGGLFTTLGISVIILNTDRAPVLDTIGPHGGAEAAPLSFTVHASDPDLDTVILNATSVPDGATFSAATGTFSWTPAYGQAGTYTVTFSATSGGLSATEDVLLTIAHTNRGPTLGALGTLNGEEGTLLSFQLVASDPDNDQLTYSAVGLPSGATLDAVSGQFSWTPGFTAAGTYPVTWRVTDSSGLSFAVGAPIVIANTNRAPEVEPISSQQLSERDTVSFVITASDPDGETLTLSAVGLPAGASFDATSGVFLWTPTYGQAGIYTLTFKATDPAGLSGTTRVAMTVFGTNGAPLLNEINPISIAAGRTVSFIALASDPNHDALTFTAQRLPPGASLDPFTGAFTWPSLTTQTGTYAVTLIATDPNGLFDTTVVSITLTANRPPLFDLIPPQTTSERQILSFQISATDAEDDPLTFTATNLPFGANFDRSTRAFRWVPTFDQSGDYEVTFTVSDGLDTTTTLAFIVVENTNRRPLLMPIAAQSGAENALITLTVQGTDPDDDRLTYAALGLPPGAVLNSSTHVFTWTPTFDQADDYTVTFVVTDAGGLTDQVDVSISVANTNRPPVIDPIGQQMGLEGEPLSFQITGADPDGDNITFSATTLPAGATFDPATQLFEWTPSFDQAGTHSVVFKATDEGGLFITRTASILVANENRSPAIVPLDVQRGSEGALLSFVITATDPDQDIVTFSFESAPAGATIDPATGAFTWTPGYTDAGTHTVIVIARDAAGATTTGAVSIVITNARRRPILTPIGSKSGAEAINLAFTIVASDPDGGILSYAAQNLPEGATLAAGTGAFSWTPGYVQAGSYDVLFTVTNDASLTVSELVTISIANTNRTPVVMPLADIRSLVKTPVQFTAMGSDPDGDTLTWTATNLPMGATLVGPAFAWTPTNPQIGESIVTITASDGTLSASIDVRMIISAGTNGPVFAAIPNPVQAPTGKPLNLAISATDADGDTVTIQAHNLPGNATFDRLLGQVSWTPTLADVGSHEVSFTATDSTGLTATASTTIIVTKSSVKTGCQCGPGGDASALLLLGLLVLTRRRRSVA